ncbi:hydantoinase/oxoprolinase family protein [uncultured Jannaschia sp.]|uniref:hydantoinase/oxoprolinase family protein n=1 Tax=uncultured Jannaschia sp. TaxID=293347 RepID=UPI00260A0A5E|nr:hydantoinase/oxoprolinase family protein [uncultured Jannaschia sp.]
MSTRTRLSADIGGTFTDVVLAHGGALHSTKVLTTYDAPERAILDGMETVCAKAGIAPAAIEQVLHGTTLATNALIERRGANTVLVTTEGFRDVIEMRTESRFEQYDLNIVLPEPLLPRDRRLTVRERMDADGAPLVALNEAAIAETCAALRDAAPFDSVAIALIHAYANPAHERMLRDAIADAFPEAAISISSEVSPQMREYERFNTTVANAYIKPLMKSYLDRLGGAMAARGVTAPIFMIHSGGGLMSLGDAAEFPVRLVESGPAGGAVFAADLARRHGLDRVLSFDMGGTTAKICLIRDATPKTARVFEVARSARFAKGSGMPISIPVIDMVEIGAGGGSLAWRDAMGQVRVGPESAGSEPGPACYGRGGDRPAVTDADLVLGKLDPENFAGGAFVLDTAASVAALERLEMTALDAAHATAEIVDETMANAARVHAVENGEVLSGYTMIAFGGAAPLHAARLCEKLGIGRCLVPVGAGVGSAIGFLHAPVSFEATRTVFMSLDAYGEDTARRLIDLLAEEAETFVRTCAPEGALRRSVKVHMRYRGQGWEIPVDLDDGLSAATVAARFEAAYETLFGRTVSGMTPEITVWSVTAFHPAPASDPVQGVADAGPANASAHRDLFDPASGTTVSAGLLARSDVSPGMSAAGPVLVTERETTVVVPASRHLRVLGDGTLDLHVPEAP